MQPAYEHPPRNARFYLTYAGSLFAVIIPCFALIPIVLEGELRPIIFILMALIALWRIYTLRKPFMQTLIIIEDLAIEKGQDISHLKLEAPVQLNEILLQLELAGFERMGEEESFIGLSDVPAQIWLLNKDDGKIIAEAIVKPDTAQAYLAFVSYSTDRLVMTYYGIRTLKVRTENAHITAIKTNIEDAIAYHRIQAKKMCNDPIAVQSLQHLNEIGKQYVPILKTQLQRTLFISTLIHMTVSAFIAVAVLAWSPVFGEGYEVRSFQLGYGIIVVGIIFQLLLKRQFAAINPSRHLKAKRHKTSLEASA